MRASSLVYLALHTVSIAARVSGGHTQISFASFDQSPCNQGINRKSFGGRISRHPKATFQRKSTFVVLLCSELEGHNIERFGLSVNPFQLFVVDATKVSCCSAQNGSSRTSFQLVPNNKQDQVPRSKTPGEGQSCVQAKREMLSLHQIRRPILFCAKCKLLCHKEV